MSLLFIDGFDHYTEMSEKWDAESLSPAGITPLLGGSGRFTPGNALELGAANGNTRTKNLPLTTDIIFGFAINLNPSTVIFMNIPTSQAETTYDLEMNPGSGIVKLKHNYGAMVSVSTAASKITSDTWFYVEARIKQGVSDGELEIRINGVEEAKATGLDTATGGGSGITGFTVRSSSSITHSFMDDLYILDTNGTSNNDFLGDVRVSTHYPKDNGTENDFFPTGAAVNFDAVNETIANGDTDFIESGLIGAKDNYDNDNFTDLSMAPGTIFGVQVVNELHKTDAAQLKYRDQMVIAGVAYDTGLDIAAAASIYKMTTYIRDTDPSDDATWTEAKVDACGSGIEITVRQT